MNIKKIKLTREEQWIEDHWDEFVPSSKEEYNAIVRSLEARKKDAVLNIRVNKLTLAVLKQKAQKAGIRYQTFISEILSKVAGVQ